MKQLSINMTTVMFISEDSANLILGIYNSHSNVLAYNKPMVSGKELTEMEVACKALSHTPTKKVEKVETDSFGVHFWNARKGSYSEFHEVVKDRKPPKLRDIYVGPMEN